MMQDNTPINFYIKYFSINCQIKKLQPIFDSFVPPCIRKGCYPPGEVVNQFIEKTGSQGTVMVIKSKIQQLIKIK
jgi:hypothetical protein